MGLLALLSARQFALPLQLTSLRCGAVRTRSTAEQTVLLMVTFRKPVSRLPSLVQKKKILNYPP
jgi:hypothetical protein